jgi:hypothetical protein
MSESTRAQLGRIGAYVSWANTDDRSARTAPGRRKFLDKFEEQIDPNKQLPPAERARRAEFARKAYFSRLALKSAQARRRRSGSAA